MRKMKNKNGFTLVELLAVIVVLAIIMIIAIPSVLDVMSNARKTSFVLYVEKIVGAVQTQYMYDANGGSIKGAGLYVYDLTSDLNLNSTGDYKGYVLVDATDVDNVQYIVSMWDNNYRLLNYNISTAGMPTVETDTLLAYDASAVAQYAGTPVAVCSSHYQEGANICYNREGFLWQEG